MYENESFEPFVGQKLPFTTFNGYIQYANFVADTISRILEDFKRNRSCGIRVLRDFL